MAQTIQIDSVKLIVNDGIDPAVIQQVLESNVGILMNTYISLLSDKTPTVINISYVQESTEVGTTPVVLTDKYLIDMKLTNVLSGIPLGDSQFGTYDMATIFSHEMSHTLLFFPRSHSPSGNAYK